MMNTPIQSLVQDYPVIVERAVIWGDMDAARHVNNTVYVKWSEVGRTEYFQAIDPEGLAGGGGRFGPILHSVSCKFIYPVTYPDTVYIGTRVQEIKRDRYIMETLIVSKHHQRVAALATGTIVQYDYQALKKVDLPADFEKEIREFEFKLKKGKNMEK